MSTVSHRVYQTSFKLPDMVLIIFLCGWLWLFANCTVRKPVGRQWSWQWQLWSVEWFWCAWSIYVSTAKTENDCSLCMPNHKTSISTKTQSDRGLLYPGCFVAYLALNQFNFPLAGIWGNFRFVEVNHWQVCGSHLSEYREELPGNITPFILFTLDAPFFLRKK